ncbi:Titin isoform 1 [Schistosoma japonicum]|uniref:Titin isoform 1 n=1 Tax=Schistosoma japonicum TaxID=6182 RepID=A0A4Z2DJQ2_SCHJA|nr:Titin isoform 1 [Schistosoma japonicum]
MASPEVGMAYQLPSQFSPQSGNLATSTKVLNLSRAQVNLAQPSQGVYPTSVSPQPSNQANAYNYLNQQSQSPLSYTYPGQTGAELTDNNFNRTGYQNSPQPQVYTVGASQASQMQQTQYRQQNQQPQQTQQYRVIATPLQTTNMGQMNAYPMDQSNSQPSYNTQPNVIYFGQGAETQHQLPPQQPYHQQTQPQGSQVIYARSASQSYAPPGNAYPTQAQFASQANTGTLAYQPTNQVTTSPQPITIQPSHLANQLNQQNFNQPPRFQHVSNPTSISQPPQFQTQNQQVYYQNQSKPQQHHQQQQPYSSQINFNQVESKPVQIAQSTWSAQPNNQVIDSRPNQQYYHQQQQQQPVQAYQQVQNNKPYTQDTLPPIVPGQTFDQQQVNRRVPTGGQTKQIKAKSLPMRNSVSVDEASGPPQFVVHPVGQLTIAEGEPANITARVRPAGDSTLNVEWYKNGKPLAAASRFTTTFDRGYAVLDFLYVNEDDNGDYSCVATNSQGQDQSSSCHVTIIPEEGVVTETQLPEESMIANLAMMEDHLVKNGLDRANRYHDDIRPTNPPVFLKPLAPQVGLRESAPAHFETCVEPTNDNSLTVEWYKDGKPVSMGCRFNAVLDRGFAILDILYCYPEDNGAYFCVARNAAGQVQSNVVELQCDAEEHIVTSSVLSKESISYLQSLDAWESDAMAGYDTVKRDDDEPPCAPSFDILPVAVTVTEGSPAKFIVKAGGNPRPKIYWYINGELTASSGGGGNWRIFQDGGISNLEFHRVGTPGEFNIKAVARNNLGEATTETVLIIEPHLDFRPDLRHVQPDNPFKKLAQLKKVECSHELSSAFKKPKAQALDLRRLERALENRGRSAAGTEVEEVENLYSRVQSQLRTNRRSSVPPRIPAQPQLQNAQPTDVQFQRQPVAPPSTQQQNNFQPPMQKPTPRPQFQAPVAPQAQPQQQFQQYQQPQPQQQKFQQPNGMIRMNAPLNQHPNQPSPPVPVSQPLTINPPGMAQHMQTPVASPMKVPSPAQPTPPPPPPPMIPAAQTTPNTTLPPPPSSPLVPPPVMNSLMQFSDPSPAQTAYSDAVSAEFTIQL